jgi:hypothetical protein
VIAGPARVAFPPDFPDVLIQRPFNPAAKPARHPDHDAAKAGDRDAAIRFVMAMVVPDKLPTLGALVSGAAAMVVAPHAMEAVGRNAIPETYAHYVSDMLGLRLDRMIVQANRPERTGRDGAYRLAARAQFDGLVEPGRTYLLVDDNVTQGGTLADLRSYILLAGGNVVGATTLTGSRSSEILAPRSETLAGLRDKFPDLEAKWKAAFGYDFSGLTQGEATYLLRSKPADALGDRIIAGRQAGHPPPT